MKNERRLTVHPRSNYGKNLLVQKKQNYIKAALYVGIAALLLLSAVFISKAGETVPSESIVAMQSGAISDASGEDPFQESLIAPEFILKQELPIIYGVDLKEITPEDTESPLETDFYFKVLPEDIQMEILKFTSDAPKQFSVGKAGPQILIYHTHTEEAYRQIPGDEYTESGKWYTKEQNESLVAVGEALKEALEGYGFSVIHDTTDHIPPSLSTAYSRSLVTMENYVEQYPTLRIFIDVHRDSYGDIDAGSRDYITVNGDQCARVMCVVGTGKGYTGAGFDGKPNYESNYKLALAITNQMESIKKGFTRPIRVKTGRYNQQVSDMCLLFEMGHNANTLEQAKNSAKYLARAISRVVSIG